MKNAFSISAVFSFIALLILSTSSTQAQVADPYKVFPFPRNQVKLLSGSPFKIAETRALNWGKTINVDQFLKIFYQGYGLPTSGMPDPNGWEAPSQKLRGHMTGHTLSALGLGYAASGDATIKSNLEKLIDGLDECQSRATSQGMNEGCLSAYGEGQFDALENGGGYPNDCWAPWYTQHKLLAGLIMCYQAAGNETALKIAKLMGTWAYNRLSQVSANTLQSMWSRYIAGEYGGYNEAAAELYMITGDETYSDLATLFDDNSNTGASLTNLTSNTDRLGGTHANMYLPRGVGYLRTYDATEDDKYYTAALNFYNMVCDHHSFSIGGHNANSGNCEAFNNRDAIASEVKAGRDRTCEHCGTYNSSKWCNYMFYHDPKESYANFYERWCMNHLLSNSRIENGTSGWSPLSSYMTDVKLGARIKEWQGSYTCCFGTGVETHLRYKDGIYAHSGDTLYINQFIPSELTWPEKNVTVTMEGSYPESDALKISITATEPIRMYIKIRSPKWIRRPIGIAVNDTVRHQGPINGGTYFVLRRTAWKKPNTPEVVDLIIPQTLWFEETPDDASVGSILYGNCVLAANTNSTSFQNVNASTITKSGGSELRFTSTSPQLTFIPFYDIGGENYSIYTNISNIPSSWTDVELDQENDPIFDYDTTLGPTDIIGEAIFSKIQGAAVKMAKSHLQLTFASPFTKDHTLRVQLFNVQGAKLAELSGVMSKGSRSITLGSQKLELPMGAYVIRIGIGQEEFRASLTCHMH